MLVVVVLLAVVSGVGPAGGRARGLLGVECASAQAAPATVADAVRVGLVIDRGPLGGGVSVQCVTLPSGSTGFDLLRTAGHTFRLNSAGLTCGIDGGPATGCGERVGASYRYWAYFHTDAGQWRYASDGPAAQRLRDGDVEGWHFVEGSGTPSDPPPAGPADHAAICPPLPPPPTVGGSGPAPTTGPTPPPGGAAPVPSPAGGSPTTVADGAGGEQPGTTTSSPAAGDGTGAATDEVGTTVPGQAAAVAAGTGADPSVLVAAPASSTGGGSGGDPGRGALLPVLFVLVVLGGLGGVAFRRLRREAGA